MFHFDINTLTLAGVAAHLLGSLAKTVFRKPAQQAQIDRIEAKISDTLAQVSPVLTALQSTNVQASSPAALAASSTVPKGPTQ